MTPYSIDRIDQAARCGSFTWTLRSTLPVRTASSKRPITARMRSFGFAMFAVLGMFAAAAVNANGYAETDGIRGANDSKTISSLDGRVEGRVDDRALAQYQPIDLRHSLFGPIGLHPSAQGVPTNHSEGATTFLPADARWSDQFALGIGCNGPVYAITRGDDGAYFVGGRFTTCGNVFSRNVARFDPGTGSWSALISPITNGVGGEVRSLYFWSNNLYVAGRIGFGLTDAGTNIGRNVVRWDGSAWHAMGSGLGDYANAVAVINGVVYVGGSFNFVDQNGQFIEAIARWNGTAWLALDSAGASRLDREVTAITEFNGQLVVAGYFGTGGEGAASVNVFRIARWSGSQWLPLGNSGGNGLSNWVSSMVEWQGSLYVGGNFTTANVGGGTQQVAASYIARWDGSSWSALGAGVDARVLSVLGLDDKLFVGGKFSTAGGAPAERLASWNGVTWQAVAGSMVGNNSFDNISTVAALARGEAGLLIGGDFGRVARPPSTSLDSVVVNNVTELASQAFQPLGAPAGNGVNGFVTSFVYFRGDLYIGGKFTAVGSVAANNIARWDGQQWHAVGVNGGNGVDDAVYALTASDDNLFVGGAFRTANLGGGDLSTNLLARWDGSNWLALDLGRMSYPGPLVAELLWSAPYLYAAGDFAVRDAADPNTTAVGVARWDGVNWSALGTGINAGVLGRAWALAKIGNDIYVGGTFEYAIEGDFNSVVRVDHLARWDGSSWTGVGTSGGAGVAAFQQPEVHALAVVGNDLFVGGQFQLVNAGGTAPVSARGLARWDGQTWHAVGSGFNVGLNGVVVEILPHAGSLFVAGSFNEAVHADAVLRTSGVAKWDGQQWSSLGSGIGTANFGYVATLSLDLSGGLLVGGGFGEAGRKPSSNLARFDLTDPSIFSSGFEQP